MMRNRWYVTLVLCLTLLLAGMVSGCEPSPPPTETPEVVTDTLEEIRQACQAQSERGRKEQSVIPEGLKYPPYQDLLYIKDQVIVTGPQEDVSAVIEILDLALERLDKVDLGAQDQSKQVAIQLHQISDGKSVEQVTCEINELRETKPELAVFADPNYHTSPAGGWTGGGSSWTQNGEWAKAPLGGGLAEAPSGQFLTQWAFGTDGIGLFDSNGNRLVTRMGREEIRIGIFDTSPFTEVAVGEERVIPFQDLMRGVNLKPSAEEAPLTVWHPVELTPAPDCPGVNRRTGTSLEGQNISNHGLFVAGLAHAVAPSSEIYLVRVLENDGCGGLFAIYKGIEIFKDKMRNEDGTLDGTVINLSLGIHEPPNPSRFGLPEEVTSLEHMLEMAVEEGAIVVAAAGNDSFDKLPPGPPSQMEIPAQYPFVIGVAASNVESGRGCFSNMGDMGAPGGDGELVEKTPCALPDCLKTPDLCLISLAQGSSTGYAYWVGTSFSTPLVSGLASLLLNAGVPPTDVFGALQAGATPVDPGLYLGDGIINVQNSVP
jgi:hypothetical protein